MKAAPKSTASRSDINFPIRRVDRLAELTVPALAKNGETGGAEATATQTVPSGMGDHDTQTPAT